MALDFPTSPSSGDEYTIGTKTYAWDGIGWNLKAIVLRHEDLTSIGTQTHAQLETAIALNTAKVSNVAHPLVETAVPSGAVFTDTVYTHPYMDGSLHVPATGTTNSGKVLTAGSTTGSLSWATLSVGGTVDGVSGSVGLVKITDGSSGYRLDRDVLANKGGLGSGAVDLSAPGTTASSTLGATAQSSIATGYKTTASGWYSTAMGSTTIASGWYSTAMGRDTTASGASSIAVGHFSTASGLYSTAMGNQANASGASSAALGYQANASGDNSTAFGYYTGASGWYSTAMGRNTAATAESSTAIGTYTTASGKYSTAMGRYSTASGQSSTSMGGYSTASGHSSLAVGSYTTASGSYSTAMGYNTAASGDYSTALGYQTMASGISSVSIGKNAQISQNGCLGLGYQTTTTGYNIGIKANQNLRILLNGETGDGYFDGSADLGNADYAEYFEWIDGNPDDEDRRGYTVSLVGEKIKIAEEGDTIIGAISAAPAIVGDSASLRWANKYELDEFGAKIMIPYTMTEWVETTVEIPGDGEDQTEYTREENHSYHSDFIPEDLVVPSDATIRSVDSNGKPLMEAKLNPNWDAASEYVPRSARKEWSPVGLLGKLHTRKDQVVGSNWIKLSDVNESIVRYLVR